MTTLTASRGVLDTLAARQQALTVLDPLVCDALRDAATRWRLPAPVEINLTVYDRVYGRSPQVGGHWTLFGSHTDRAQHEAASLSVAVEFDGDAPADLCVSGVRDVRAGACSATALHEALHECGGPLRQITSFAPAPTAILGAPARGGAAVLQPLLPAR